jgi:hypothetical protein
MAGTSPAMTGETDEGGLKVEHQNDKHIAPVAAPSIADRR